MQDRPPKQRLFLRAMNLVLVDAGEVSRGQEVRLSGIRAAHLLNVLKVVPQQRVRVGMLDGPSGTGTVVAVGHMTVTLRCEFETVAAPRPVVDLLLALPRPKVLRRL